MVRTVVHVHGSPLLFGCEGCIAIANGYLESTNPLVGMVTRASLSLPCSVPVLPGTSDQEAPIEKRTEACNIDAWWFMGVAPCCDIHMRRLLGDQDYEVMRRDFEREGWPMDQDRARDGVPWENRHRYSQDQRVEPPTSPDTSVDREG